MLGYLEDTAPVGRLVSHYDALMLYYAPRSLSVCARYRSCRHLCEPTCLPHHGSLSATAVPTMNSVFDWCTTCGACSAITRIWSGMTAPEDCGVGISGGTASYRNSPHGTSSWSFSRRMPWPRLGCAMKYGSRGSR